HTVMDIRTFYGEGHPLIVLQAPELSAPYGFVLEDVEIRHAFAALVHHRHFIGIGSGRTGIIQVPAGCFDEVPFDIHQLRVGPKEALHKVRARDEITGRDECADADPLAQRVVWFLRLLFIGHDTYSAAMVAGRLPTIS